MVLVAARWGGRLGRILRSFDGGRRRLKNESSALHDTPRSRSATDRVSTPCRCLDRLVTAGGLGRCQGEGGRTWRHPPISNREKKAKTQKCFDAEHSSRCAVVDSSGSGLRGLWAVPRLSIDVGEIPRQIF